MQQKPNQIEKRIMKLVVGVCGVLSSYFIAIAASKKLQNPLQRPVFPQAGKEHPIGKPATSLAWFNNNRISLSSRSFSPIEAIPRGGDTSVRDNLMAVYLLCHGLIAIVGVPAPEVASHQIGDVVIPEGSITYLFAEAMYTAVASLVTLLALVKYTDISIARAFAIATTLFTYFVYKHLVKDSYDDFGFRKGGGLALTVFLVFLTVNMWVKTGIVDPELSAMIVCGYFLLQSTLSIVSPSVGALWYGLAKTPKGNFSSVFRWAHVTQFILGAAGLSLLCGKSIDTTTAIASSLGALALLEQIFGENLGIAKTREMAMVGLAVQVLVAVGLFLA